MTDFAVTTNFTNGTLADADEVNQNYEDIEDAFNGNRDGYSQVPSMSPIGSVVGWLKTFATADSGQTTSTTSDKLVQTGQNFQTTIEVGMIVHNTTDDTYANVSAVDSDTTLSIDADVMASGEDFIIYKTPKLADGWVECDGTAISDADSVYNGENTPDINGTPSFLRGATSSGTTGGAETATLATANLPANATFPYSVSDTGDAGNNFIVDTTNAGTRSMAIGGSATAFSILPTYYEIVWIMRIK